MMKLMDVRSSLFACLVVCTFFFPKALAASEELEESYFGMSMRFVAAKSAIWVVEVTPRAPADLAGLKANDLIVAVNGETPEFDNDLDMLRLFEEFRPGDRVLFTVLRNGITREIAVEAKAMAAEAYQRLAKWKESTEARLKEGEDIYSCNEQEFEAAIRNQSSLRWSRFLRTVGENGAEIVFSKEKGSGLVVLDIRGTREGSLVGLSLDDITLPEIGFLSNDLRPGDSFSLAILFNQEERYWTMKVEHLPAYLVEKFDAYMRSLKQSTSLGNS